MQATLRLDENTSLELAEELTIIPHFPNHPRALRVAADWLLKTCRGNANHTPYDQAQRVVEAAVEGLRAWDKEAGLPALRDIYVRLFVTPQAMSYTSPDWLREAPPEPDCQKCASNGQYFEDGRYHLCTCDAVTPDVVDLVRKLNSRLPKKPGMQKAGELLAPRIEPEIAPRPAITEEDIRRAEAEYRRQKAEGI